MIISMISGKGGVGKTACTANLGLMLSQMGCKILLIDGDIGMKNLDIYLGLENKISYDILNILNKECSIEDAIVKYNENLDLISTSLAGTTVDVNRDEFVSLCESLRNSYDFIIIDGQKGFEKGFIDSIFPADLCIIIVTPDTPSLRTADKVLGIVSSYNKSSLIIVNKYDKKMAKKEVFKTIEDISDLLKEPIVGVIPYDEDMMVYLSKGHCIVEKTRSDINKSFLSMAEKICSLVKK